MPQLSENNRQDITRLRLFYDALPADEKLGFPPRTSAALSSYQSGSPTETEQALEICQAFLSEAQAIQQFSCFEAFSGSALIYTVTLLNHWNLLNEHVQGQLNFNTVVNHQNPLLVINAIRRLNNVQVLYREPANHNAVARHPNPPLVADALLMLHFNGLLTGEAAQVIRNAIAAHQRPDSVARALVQLNAAGLLTGVAAQVNFNAIMAHSAILFGPGVTELWARIPFLAQGQFTALIAICQQHTGDQAAGRRDVITYINGQILGIQQPAAARPAAFSFFPIYSLADMNSKDDDSAATRTPKQ